MTLLALLLVIFRLHAGAPAKLVTAELLERSKPSDWRELKPENTLYMELATGRVIIELAPDFAPNHVKNIKALAAEKYWDGLAIVRVQDNYVTQWGDPNGDKPELKKKIKKAKDTLPAEFDRELSAKIPFTPLGDRDVYAPEVGFSGGFPVARDSEAKKMWPLHCYGMVGAGRGMTADSGGGAELYVVIGHSPRHLDRNVTLVGRVVQGMELLSSLPRGKAPLGFYDKPGLNVPIASVRLASDVAKKDRTKIEILRTDTELFKNLIEARRNRQEEWFLNKAGHVEVCNVPVTVREKK
jgi:peptidylprolyl isomerase